MTPPSSSLSRHLVQLSFNVHYMAHHAKPGRPLYSSWTKQSWRILTVKQATRMGVNLVLLCETTPTTMEVSTISCCWSSLAHHLKCYNSHYLVHRRTLLGFSPQGCFVVICGLRLQWSTAVPSLAPQVPAGAPSTLTGASLAAQQDWLRHFVYLPGTDARLANNSKDNASG